MYLHYVFYKQQIYIETIQIYFIVKDTQLESICSIHDQCI